MKRALRSVELILFGISFFASACGGTEGSTSQGQGSTSSSGSTGGTSSTSTTAGSGGASTTAGTGGGASTTAGSGGGGAAGGGGGSSSSGPSCGAADQPCCPDDGCNADLVCSAGICKCGDVAQPCCGGTTCGADLACVVGTCACGDSTEPCCGGTTCGANLVCVAGACQCGEVTEPCCGGTTCDTNLACVAGACQCGELAEPCCGGTTCGAGLSCSGGVCACGGDGEACCGGTTCNDAHLFCTAGTCGCGGPVSLVVLHAVGPDQLGYDPAFGAAADVPGATLNRAATVLDDAGSGIAALLVTTSTQGADVAADSLFYRTAVAAVFGGSAHVMIAGRAFTTHELLPAVHSVLRIASAASTSASALRDSLVTPLSGGSAPGGGSAGAGQTSFYVDLTTVRRSATAVDLVIAVAPAALADDPAQSTSVRVVDLASATGVAGGGTVLENQCDGLPGGPVSTVDFIWTIDVSPSIDSLQAMLGNATAQFVAPLEAAAVDYRVGIFTAEGQLPINLAANYPYGWPGGFKMIPDAAMAANADRWLCRYVTAPGSGANAFCPPDLNKVNDPYGPFGAAGGTDAEEEPLAGVVRVNDLLKKNLASGVAQADWKWRAGAARAAFMLTDEFNNDWTRYFKTAVNPDTNTVWSPGGVYSAAVLAKVVKYLQDNQLLTAGIVPLNANPPRACSPAPNSADLARCAIEGSGGSYADANLGTPADISAVMARLALDAIGASSSVVLPRSPIASTLRLRVNGANVPRSRVDGFDYDLHARSIVFYGKTYRPQPGETIEITFEAWSGSSG